MTDLATIADAADALTNPIRVREPYTVWVNRNRVTKVWEHTVPSVYDQLAAAIIPGETHVEGGGAAGAARSKPAARIEAVSVLLQIDAAAAYWVDQVGLKLRPNTPSNVRALVGAQTESDTEKLILHDMRRWYGWAATLSGWERIFKPDAPCPACDTKGFLRVNLTRQTATCMLRDTGETGCGDIWDQTTIGILAAHIEKTSSKPHYDTAHLRTAIINQRRTEEAVRYAHETRRPAVLRGLLDQPSR